LDYMMIDPLGSLPSLLFYSPRTRWAWHSNSCHGNHS
jgi:hypothetical protein